MSQVVKFYNDKTIFITGATGFMGKVLVEKLLFSCPGLKRIYVLIREKRGKSGEERIAEFSKLPLFERITKGKPEVLKRMVPVYGDITKVDLGLSSDDLERLTKETNIIYHLAATVVFEAPLKIAVEMNIRGVDYVMQLAKRMTQLIVMVHLSTTFCYCDQEVLMEKVYDSKIDPRFLINCTEFMDEATMNKMTAHILAPHPNTYTFTKRMAELLVRSEYPELPVCIARPSIVTPTFKEPIAGWVDNFNGPVGVILGGGKGVIRSMLCDGNAHMECVPVDFAINGLILIAWIFGSMPKRPPGIPVYNMTTPSHLRFSWRYLLDEGRKIAFQYPCEAGIWYPDGDITTNKFVHYFRVIFTQWVPAYLVDGICFLLGKKTFLVKIQKKISLGMNMLQYFSTRKWDFRAEKASQVKTILNDEDIKIFPTEIDKMDVLNYLKDAWLGGRQYCLKEPLSTLPKARIQLKIMRVLDIVATIIWAILFLWLLKVLFGKLFF